MRIRKKVSKYSGGGDILSMLTNTLGTAIEGAGTNSDGTMDTGASALGGGLKGLGKGFMLGNALLPGLGGLIGGVGGGLIGAISGSQEAKEQQRLAASAALRDRLNKQRIMKQKMAATNAVYPVEGYGNINYFAKGGDMKLYGGSAQPIAPNVSRVVGDQHGQDTDMDGQQGIRVHHNGVAKAEIENGEVMAGSKVFSAQMLVPGTDMTFADMAARVAQSAESKLVQRFKKKLEDAEEPKQSATAKRMLEKHVDPLDSLFDTQEQVKAEEEQMMAQQQEQAMQQPQMEGAEGALPLGAKGLDLNALGSAAESILPFLDNIANSQLIRKTPQIPKPLMMDAPIIQTEYDINPMLANVNRQQSLRNLGLKQNTNNDAVLRGNMIAGYASDRDAINSLIGTKTNAEIQMRNQQAGLMQQAQGRNIDALNNFNFMNMQRTDDIHARTSANVANATQDAMGMRRTHNEKILDKQKLAITLAAYANTGVLDRAEIMPVMQMIEQGMDINDAMQEVKNRKNNSTVNPLDKSGTPNAISSLTSNRVKELPYNPKSVQALKSKLNSNNLPLTGPELPKELFNLPNITDNSVEPTRSGDNSLAGLVELVGGKLAPTTKVKQTTSTTVPKTTKAVTLKKPTTPSIGTTTSTPKTDPRIERITNTTPVTDIVKLLDEVGFRNEDYSIRWPDIDPDGTLQAKWLGMSAPDKIKLANTLRMNIENARRKAGNKK